MHVVTVQLASGQAVVTDFFLDVFSTFSKLADAVGAQLAVASSRCVLLSLSVDCLTHSLTPSATNLTDGDVVTVLVMDLPRVYAHPEDLAFAAVAHDGSVVTWEHAACGGNSESEKSELQGGVDHVVGTQRAFAAVKQDGSVVTWGDARFGGNADEVRDQLTDGVRDIFGNTQAFAALKEDGSVVTWGDAGSGGNSDSVKGQLPAGVSHVAGTQRTFAAVREDGSVVTWGDADLGGNSDEVKAELQSGVLRMNANVAA